MDNSPLSGIRILDLTHSWAGPHATRLLADFGAEVIRIEFPGRLCMFRGGVVENGAYNGHPPWLQLNRNKYCITLDLKRESQKKILQDLVKDADCFVENSRPGVMESLGFGYRDLCRLNSGIIMLSMSGFGSSGPYARYCGYGAVFEAMGGIQSFTAYGPGKKPQRIREMDVINGLGGAGALLTALIYRQRTGEGQHIDLSQMEFASHLLIGEHLLEQAMNGTSPGPTGNQHRLSAPQGCYPCQGEDKWVTLSAHSDREWQGLCEALGRPDLAREARFADREGRYEHQDELDRIITAWSSRLPHREAMDILQRHGVPAGAVLDTRELTNDPHLEARDFFLAAESSPDQRYPGVPYKFAPPGRVRWPGPDLGEHNAYVVRDILGRPDEDVPEVREEEIRTAYDSEQNSSPP